MLLRGPRNGCMSTTAELNARDKQEFDNEVFDYDPLQLSLNRNGSHAATQKKPSTRGIPPLPFCCLFCPLESSWQNIFAHATRRQTLRQVSPSACDKRDARCKSSISMRVEFAFCLHQQRVAIDRKCRKQATVGHKIQNVWTNKEAAMKKQQ